MAVAVSETTEAITTDSVTLDTATTTVSNTIQNTCVAEQNEEKKEYDEEGTLNPVAPKVPSTYVFRPGKTVEGKLIAITFDDGPNRKSTQKILNTLEKYNAVATFFIVGRDVNSTTEAYLKRAVDMGCELANHTWAHSYLSILNYDELQETIENTNAKIRKITGHNPNFYRPPYIDVDNYVLDCIDMPGLSGYGSGDWRLNYTPKMIADTVLRQARPNRIFVMHDQASNARTPEAIETIIPRLQEAGYTFVTVTDLFTSLGITPQSHALYITPEDRSYPSAGATYRVRTKTKVKTPQPASPVEE